MKVDKIRIKLMMDNGRELDRQDIETSAIGSEWRVANEIIEALKAWPLGPGDTIKIVEVE